MTNMNKRPRPEEWDASNSDDEEVPIPSPAKKPAKNELPVQLIQHDMDDAVETIFNFDVTSSSLSDIGTRYLKIERRLCRKLNDVLIGDKFLSYNPLMYAFDTHKNFVSKYCTSERKFLFLGINPGPYGMSQNGVPFGDTEAVRDWLNITGKVNKPSKEHPARPILGLDCHRKEVSGRRFWGLMKELCDSPFDFFKHCFVYNYCPLQYMFLTKSAKNITFDKLPKEKRDDIYTACDCALQKVVELFGVTKIIAIGTVAEKRVKKVLCSDIDAGNLDVVRILHPSPANPKAHTGWDVKTANILKEHLVDIFPKLEIMVQKPVNVTIRSEPVST